MNSYRLLGTFLLSLSLAGSAAAQSMDATIDRATKAWSKAKTARASFEQTITNALTGGTATARGEFFQQRPGLLAVRFSDPSGDRIVSDGKSIWIYLPSSAPGQVIKRPARAGGVPLDFTGQFLDQPRRRYTISDSGSEAVGGATARVLVLVPRTGVDAPFTRAKVWISESDAMIRQFEIKEHNGVTRRVRLTSLTMNAPVERGEFVFKAPRGVRVVEQR